MPTINPTLPSDGDDVIVAAYNDPLNTILDLLNGGLDHENLADDAVTADKIADGNINTDKLADDAVTTAKIADGAVTADQLGASAVTGPKILNGAVGPDKLATGAQEANNTSNSGTTTSTSYTATLTSGGTNPEVTATIGANGMALVTIYAHTNNAGANVATYTSFAISGATTQAAADNLSIRYNIPSSGGQHGASATFLITGLTPGSNTFTMQYRVPSSTGTWAFRRIAVIPL